jgi:formylglycine-generating enzyme required for sulfatase activity
MRIRAILMAIILACTVHASQAPQIFIAVMPITGAPENTENLIAFTDLLTAELAKNRYYSVIGTNDVVSAMEHAAASQSISPCNTDSCFMQMGGMLGAAYVVSGTFTTAHDTSSLDLRLVDIEASETKSRVRRCFTGGAGRIVDDIPSMVVELLKTGFGVEPEPSQKPQGPLDAQIIRSENDEMSFIPGGTFVMGIAGQTGYVPEKAHPVILDGYYIDKHEVTQEKFEKVMRSNPSWYRGQQQSGQCPVENVTWKEASDYCKKLGKRLPTEAEWEYACRSNNQGKYYWGDAEDDAYAWGGSNSDGHPHPVGMKKPNAWGLYDMIGNVREWCEDWYNAYPSEPQQNPKGPSRGKQRVLRGGSWSSSWEDLQSGWRSESTPTIRSSGFGFRCVRSSK